MADNNVSRETKEKFATYLTLLNKWQKTINLVGVETLADAEERHINDSVQLVSYVPSEAKTLFDWGSGAGFPGLVLAIARPDLKIYLIESDQRKCAFLRTVSRETKSPVTIRDDRIEDIDISSVPLPDVITARALAPLERILGWALPWAQANPYLILLLLKGEKASLEIEEALKKYDFSMVKYPSKTATESVILEIKGLCITKA